MHLINGRPEQKRNVTAGVCHSPSEKEVFKNGHLTEKVSFKEMFQVFHLENQAS